MKQIHFRYTYSFAILMICMGYLYLFLQNMPEVHQQHTFCLFHSITGLPCPACGTGRGIICILHGDLTNAWMFNPLSFIAVIFSFVAFTWMLIDLRRNRITFIPALKKPVSFRYVIIPVVLVLINWYWNITKGL